MKYERVILKISFLIIFVKILIVMFYIKLSEMHQESMTQLLIPVMNGIS